MVTKSQQVINYPDPNSITNILWFAPETLSEEKKSLILIK